MRYLIMNQLNYNAKNIIQQFHNKMASMENILKVTNNKYPFGENPCYSAIRVEQTQFFSSVESMLEKKSQMLRKREMIKNSGIINLLSISEQGSVLLYEWQYIPHSISSYVKFKFNTENDDIWQMTKNLFIKKVTFELTILMSYLAKMRIQTQLSMQTLGISHDEKLKLYLSPRSKMGIKSQLFLISHYGQAKERILRQLRAELELIKNGFDKSAPNFKTTRPYFQEKMLSNSFVESITSKSCLKNNQVEKPKNQAYKSQNQIPLRRKMSFGNFQFGNKNDFKSNIEKQKIKSPRTPRQHKYSFQYPNNNQYQKRQQPPFNESFIQAQPEPVVNHSKSIKIELEQKQNIDSKRKRKDSYKVKITTYRQYEVDDPTLFKQNGDNQDDIFEYFSKKAQKQEQQEKGTEFSPKNQSPVHHDKQNTTAHSTPPPSPLLSAKQGPISKGLQERIKLARQRSQRVLNKMKFMKK